MKRIICKGMAALMLLSGVSAYAEEIPFETEYDYNNSTVYIKGETADEGAFFALQILKSGVGFDKNISDGDVIYRGQTAAEQKSFEFCAEYVIGDEESGAYKARLAKNNGDTADFDLQLVSKKDFEAFYADLKSVAKDGGYADFVKIINERADMAGFEFELTKGVDMTPYLNGYFEFIKKNGIEKENALENVRSFKTFVVSSFINKEKLENINGFINGLNLSKALSEEYKALAGESQEVQIFFTKALSEFEMADISDFESAFKKALVLTTVRYSNGWGEVKEAVEKYGAEFGISASAANSVYQGLAGNAYNKTTFLEAYNALAKAAADEANSNNNNNSSRPSGGGGGGGGGGIASRPSNVGETEIATNINGGEATKTDIGFSDLDSVPWASEAILALADKGIINGKGDQKFAPDDLVTREEFVKILIEAMGYSDLSAKGGTFADVSEDEWYAKYVNIAYEKGIVGGVGDGKFGTGQNITRQDLATMIYNALKSKNAETASAKLEFADSETISDYAKEAVAALCGMGAINGVSETEFAPSDFATRAQAAKIIYRVFDKLR